MSKERLMGWVQKSDEQLEDLKTLVDVNEEVIHDMMATAKASQLRICERVALMIQVGIQDNKVMIEPAKLPPGKTNVRNNMGKTLHMNLMLIKVGKEKQGHKVPNEENTKLVELLDDGQDGVNLGSARPKIDFRFR